MPILKVGITGGIGSGKTTICRIFGTLGIPIYYADDAAKWLMQHDPDVRTAITEQFGAAMYLPEGILQRAALAAAVFGQPDRLRQLEAIVHPAVSKHTQAWIDTQPENTPYLLKEAAIMIESGAYRHLDRLVLVTAPIETRIARVLQRDGGDETAVRARIARQMPDEEKRRFADFIVNNDGEQLIIPQVMDIHRRLLAIAAAR